MIRRQLESVAIERATRHPVVTITGPRQSGKTTLCKAAFPGHTYANLEDQATREIALADPRAFLLRSRDGLVLDEVQRAPELLSAVQVEVDRDPRAGRFVLSGSHNFQLHRALSQSLAGRTTVLDLLPPSYAELQRFPSAPHQLFDVILGGGYPRIHDRGIPPAEFFADYVRTYVERDVRLVLNIGDLGAFQTFLRICAGRSGQLVNLSALGAECGVSHNTAKAWLSVLEASYLVTLLSPWHRNLGKRLVKSRKLYFLDCGLLCWLLGIRNREHIEVHPLRGAIFETFAHSEVLKARANRGRSEPMWFFRDRSGTEVDLVVERDDAVALVEIKAGTRVAPDALAGMARIADAAVADPTLGKPVRRFVVYAGDESTPLRETTFVPWSAIDAVPWI